MKKARFLSVVGLVLPLAGCLDLPPEGTDMEMIANYEVAVASIGCAVVSDGDYQAVELQAGLTRAQAVSISEYKLGREEAVQLEGGGIKLTSGACAPVEA